MMNWFNKKRNKKGFTLVELVVVIAILGILSAIAVPRLTNSTKKAEAAALDANIRVLNGAVSMYLASEGDTSDLIKVVSGNAGKAFDAYNELVAKGYLQDTMDKARDFDDKIKFTNVGQNPVFEKID